MPDTLNNREGPQAREPSKCLNGRNYGERLTKRLSDHQLQEARKKTLIGPQLLGQRQSVSRCTWHCQGSRKTSSCKPLTGTELPQAKRVLHLCTQGHLSRVWTLCNPVDCGLPGFCVREVGSPSKNTREYWPILVAIPF